MTRLAWDQVGDRTYETGADRGVLYLPDSGGAYNNGVAWNGLTTVTEAPTGGDANAQYADNIKYLNLISVEQFAATLEAFTYPDEFAPFDGLGTPAPGVLIGQQHRKHFGLCWRTIKGNDVDGADHGYKLHLVYGCQAAPSQKAFATVNDQPSAINFNWAISCTPVPVTGMKPTSHLVVDSTIVDPDALSALELILYGDTGVDPRLPQPDEVIALFTGTITPVTPTAPTFDSETNTITIPTVAGVAYYINDAVVPAGAVVITEDTIVVALPTAGHVFTGGVDNDWLFTHS